MIPPVKASAVDALIHSPGDLPAEYLDYLEQRKGHAGIRFGVSALDRWLAPFGPGDLIGLIGRPGHCKTTMAVYLAKREAQAIHERGENACVLYVTVDQAVEQIESIIQASPDLSLTDLAFGNYNIEQVKRQVLSRAQLPLWLVGEAISRRHETPVLTFNNLNAALLRMEELYQPMPRIALVVIDYIQAMLFERPTDRNIEVTDAIRQSKALARRLGCPVVVCVQASRAVDARDVQIPSAADCQWSSSIEQLADVLLGLWRPIKTTTKTELQMEIEYKTRTVKVDPRLLIVKAEKQKFAQAGVLVALTIAPEVVQLEDYEFHRAAEY